MLKVWTFSWGYVGVYGARPNVIGCICGEDVVKLVFLLELFELKHLVGSPFRQKRLIFTFDGKIE